MIKKVKPKYSIEIEDFEVDYYNYVIQAEGNNLEELIANAEADQVTRNGDTLGYWDTIERFSEKNWLRAIRYIKDEYKRLTPLGKVIY